jgi:hypothetical protein
MRRMADPAASPPPPAPSRWHDWWKFPLFFGVLAGAIVLLVYLGPAALLLLLLAYLVVRGAGAALRWARKGGASK